MRDSLKDFISAILNYSHYKKIIGGIMNSTHMNENDNNVYVYEFVNNILNDFKRHGIRIIKCSMVVTLTLMSMMISLFYNLF